MSMKEMTLQEAINCYRDAEWSWLPKRILYGQAEEKQWVVHEAGNYHVLTKKDMCLMASILKTTSRTEAELKEIFPRLLRENGFLTLMGEEA